VYGAIAANTQITLSIPHAGGAPIDFYVWPASSITSGKLGNLAKFTCAGQMLIFCDHAELGALTRFELSTNLLSSLNTKGLDAVLYLVLSDNQLTSISGAGLEVLNDLAIDNNSFDGPSLDALYTSLPAGTGNIGVDGNPGAGTDTPAIATDKGYTVYDGS